MIMTGNCQNHHEPCYVFWCSTHPHCSLCKTVRLWVLKSKYESSKKVQAFKTQITQKWESQMLFWDDIIRPKFSKTQVFWGTILNPTLSVWVLLLQRVTFTGYYYLVRPLGWVTKLWGKVQETVTLNCPFSTKIETAEIFYCASSKLCILTVLSNLPNGTLRVHTLKQKLLRCFKRLFL